MSNDIAEKYGLTNEQLLRRRPYQHQSSDDQVSPSLEHVYDLPERPKGTRKDQIEARTLALREGLGKIPGDIAELAELASYGMQFAPGGQIFGKPGVREILAEAAKSADRRYMSDPGYFDENKQVYPLSGDELVGGWGARIAADPLNLIGGGIANTGKPLTKFTPKVLPKAGNTIDDVARRNFLKATTATAGVGAVGGIAGLRLATKGAPEAAAKADDVVRLLNWAEWEKAGKPMGELPDYVTRIGGTVKPPDFMHYNNYQRAMWKKIRQNLTKPELESIDKVLKKATFADGRTKQGFEQIVFDLEEAVRGNKSALKVYRQYGLKPDVDSRTYLDIARIHRSRGIHKYDMTQFEKNLAKQAWNEYQPAIGSADELFNYGMTNDDIIALNARWGSTPEQTYKQVVMNDRVTYARPTTMRLKDVAEKMDQYEVSDYVPTLRIDPDAYVR